MYQGTKTTISGGIPVWKVIDHTETGGFTLDTSAIKDGTVVKAGSLMTYDESTRMAKVIASGTVIEAAAAGATSYRVAKGSIFTVGQNFAAVKGGAAYPITSIDASGSSYDVIHVGTSIGAVDAGAAVFASSATGASAAAYGTTVKGLLVEDTVTSPNVTVDIATHGVVYARRIPGITPDLILALPLIIFSNSF